MRNTLFSLFRSVLNVHGEKIRLEEFVMLLKSPAHAKAINHMQAELQKGNKAEFDRLKKMLPGVTPGGVFEGGRQKKHLKQLSSLKVFDFDHISSDKFDAVFEKAKQVPGVVLVAVSPSGEGIKIFMRVNATLEMHDEMFGYLATELEKTLGIEVDKSGKDINRLCYLPSPDGLYYNPDAVVIAKKPCNPEVKVAEGAKNTEAANATEVVKTAVSTTTGIPSHLFKNETDAYAEIVNSHVRKQWVNCEALSIHMEAKSCFKDGARNEFIFKYACKACQCGIPRPISQAWAESRYTTADFKVGEIIAAFGSGYTGNETLYGKDADKLQALVEKNVPALAEDDEITGEELYEKTSLIPDSVYSSLPQVISDALAGGRNSREKDLMLLSALTALSGCLPNVSGIYENKRHSPHIYYFVVAKPGSGKGKATLPFRLVDSWTQFLFTESKREVDTYTDELRKYNDYLDEVKELKRQRARGKKVTFPPFQEPPAKVFPIVLHESANISQIKLAARLEHNKEYGLIVLESEADNITKTQKNDWAQLNEIFRKAYHHEDVGVSRKEEDNSYHIKVPKLSIFLSGTPNQFVSFLDSPENGLFSRFGLYVYGGAMEWNSPAPHNNLQNPEQHYMGLSQQVMEYALFLRANPSKFNLTYPQWDRFNAVFSAQFKRTQETGYRFEEGVVARHGVMVFRVAMILSAIRKAERGQTSEYLMCTDEDFETAMSIVTTCFEHSRLMLSGYKVTDKHTEDLKRALYDDELLDRMAPEFVTQDFYRLGNSYKLTDSKLKRYLKGLIKRNKIVRIKKGTYAKLQN
ncbi:MAG: DUF3987 domain-containing protein [Tannerellaceae bacterium]